VAAYGGPHERIRRRGTVVALSIALAGCVSARITTLSAFSSADGHFSVTVPETMVESTSTGSGPSAAATIHSFLYDEPGGPRFVVIYGDADAGFIASKSTDAALDQFEASNVSATKGQQVSERHLTISGLPGREQHNVGPTGSYVFRMVVAGNRLYSFSVKGADLQVQQADAVVYLDSFAVTT
jgi:hypothetical protein